MAHHHQRFLLQSSQCRTGTAVHLARLWTKRVILGATYFHNDLSNLIGFNGLFETLNLGKARTEGVECELRARPLDQLGLVATYTYLDTEKLGAADVSQLPG